MEESTDYKYIKAKGGPFGFCLSLFGLGAINIIAGYIIKGAPLIEATIFFG